MDIKNQKLNINVDNISLGCDFAWCLEAFGNILKNCMEHTQDGGQLTIKAIENALDTEIVIMDDGSGIEEEDLPHIFERFYKGKDGIHGIGLSIAKAVTESRGGTLRFYNRNGAVFQAEFPLPVSS